ncbi:hypothetical protein [Mucilaginibacter sp.]|uniref:hypothetical protein n=1 Tax=Mucilaginibacter sp. TaxID=1882438 RepID=UPI0026262BA1|nr:hypothetical protein [Mucilaginibacter sp.]MDB4921232.1 hypothetical protein [Mucilaginibacter sp.]
MEKKTIVLTRKIRLRINTTDAEFKKECLKRMYGWQTACFRAANFIFSHHYLQDQIKELFYITDNVKVKLADITTDADGILTTSKENTTYQLLSRYFKGDIPMNILSPLNHTLVSLYNQERKAYWNGEKSLRNYKRNIPIPFNSQVLKLSASEGKNFKFTLFKIPFETFLGQDKSDRRSVLLKVMGGSMKIGTSQLQLEKNKTFLILSVHFDKEQHELDISVIAEASLSLEYPIAVKIGSANFLIGNKEEFLHRRIALQAARRRLQQGAAFNKSGHGRKRKLKPVINYDNHEKKYVHYKLHVYSKKLIDICIKHQAATLLLVNQEQKEEIAKEDSFLLRNWSYYGLKEKITYKANKAGITVISE